MKLPKKRSLGEETLAQHIKAHKLPAPAREFPFHSIRKWRFDFAWPELCICVDIDGMHPSGKHNTPDGIADDNEKRNEATLLGYAVLSFTTKQVTSGHAIEKLKPFVLERLALRYGFDEIWAKNGKCSA